MEVILASGISHQKFSLMSHRLATAVISME